jgi:hypothetical protein
VAREYNEEKEDSMPKFVDWSGDSEVQVVMEKFLERFPGMFEGFDVSKIGFVKTKKKKSKEALKLHCVGYPVDVFCSSKVYIVEVFEHWWKKMDTKKRNLYVFKVMCAFPSGAFDEQSKHYGKKLVPEIKMFMREYAASGGIPNWMENPAAIDPMEQTTEQMAQHSPAVDSSGVDVGSEEEVERTPVTAGDIEGAGEEGAEVVEK